MESFITILIVMLSFIVINILIWMLIIRYIAKVFAEEIRKVNIELWPSMADYLAKLITNELSKK